MPQQIIKDRLVESLKTTATWPGAASRYATHGEEPRQSTKETIMKPSVKLCNRGP